MQKWNITDVTLQAHNLGFNISKPINNSVSPALTLTNSVFYPQNVFIGFDYFPEQHWSTYLVWRYCVFFAVRAGFLNITYTSVGFKGLNGELKETWFGPTASSNHNINRGMNFSHKALLCYAKQQSTLTKTCHYSVKIKNKITANIFIK